MLKELLLLCKESACNFKLATYTKINNCSNDDFFIDTERYGKINITEDIVSLAAYFYYSTTIESDIDSMHKAYRKWQYSLSKYFDEANLHKKSADNIETVITDLANEMAYYYKSPNFLGRCSRYALIIPFHAWYNMQFKYNIDIEEVINGMISTIAIYLGILDKSKLNNNYYFNSTIEETIIEDDMLRASLLTVAYWLCKHNDRFSLRTELNNKLQDVVGNMTWEELLMSSENPCIDDYITYKTVDITEKGDLDKLEELAKKIRTEDGRLNTQDTIKYSSPYIQTINITMGNGLVSGYSDIADIKDNNFKETAVYLINRNISDNLKLIRDASYSIIYTTLKSKYAESNSRKIVNLRDKDIDNLRDKLKLKEKQYKKALNTYEEKTAFLRSKVEKLTKQIKKADMDSLKTLEDCIDMLEDENKALRESIDNFNTRENELLNQIFELESMNTKLEEDVIELNGKLLDCSDGAERMCSASREIPLDHIYNAIKHKKILLVGGNKIHNRIKERKFDSIDLLDAGDVNFTMSSMQKYDLIVIYTKLVSHSTVERLEAELKNSNITVARFNESGLTSLIHFLFNYIHGEDKSSSGCYTV